MFGKELRMAVPQDMVLIIDQMMSHQKTSKLAFCHLAQHDDMPGQKIGRQWRFRRVVVERWLGDTKSHEHEKAQEQ